MTTDKTLSAALAKAQAKMRDPVKDATNPHFRSRFVSLKGILDAVRPALSAEGIALTQEVDFEGDVTYVRTVLRYGTESIASRYPVTCSKPTDPQAWGSAITYARRYSVAAMCGVAPADEDDDDGEAAAAPARQAPKPASKPAAKPNAAIAGAGKATPFEFAEEAVDAVLAATSGLALDVVAHRIAASKDAGTLTGSDLDDVRAVFKERKQALGGAS